MATKQAKKKAGTRGMRLWNVNLVYKYPLSSMGLFILTRSRNIGLAIKKAQITINRYHEGRVIDSVEYKGTIDNQGGINGNRNNS